MSETPEPDLPTVFDAEEVPDGRVGVYDEDDSVPASNMPIFMTIKPLGGWDFPYGTR